MVDSKKEEPRQHGVKGVYYGGEWVDIEDCEGTFTPSSDGDGDADNDNDDKCSGCDFAEACCPRSESRNAVGATIDTQYDVLIVGAGCIGAAVARELAKYSLKILWVEAADDVAQGATKGNSGIVHAGYDDKPGSNRAKYCWAGNQMFAELDKELRFGYQKNGSLVIAKTKKELAALDELKKRGETNGVKRLRIVKEKELKEMEPAIHPDAIAALYSPDAGNVIPYEFTIALAENAVDNGVELRIRRKVTAIDTDTAATGFKVQLEHWEPAEYEKSLASSGGLSPGQVFFLGLAVMFMAHHGLAKLEVIPAFGADHFYVGAQVGLAIMVQLDSFLFPPKNGAIVTKSTLLKALVERAGRAIGTGPRSTVNVAEMLVGGSGSSAVMHGVPASTGPKETVSARYIINCAGGASDTVAGLIGDTSFVIKPRVGDYILLNRNQGKLAKHTLFPCPDPVLGKGVLVQTTLWGNLILGPTARDMYKPEARDMKPESVQEYILSKCKNLVPSFDARETIHAFAGARAKSTRGDWIIEPSAKNPNFIHVAGIDSPGLAGAPAIAHEVVRLLKDAGLKPSKNPDFNPQRAPIITPKSGMKGLKMGPVGKNDSDGSNTAQMAANVICKCEKVTELEVVRAMRRSLPIDSSQGIRKRTRAGMGHCQGDPDNYNCEARVRAIIARENGVPIEQVGGRPWPATSTLTERWIDDNEKEALEERKNKN